MYVLVGTSVERGRKERGVIKYSVHEKKRTLFNLLALFNCANINVMIQDLDYVCAVRNKCRERS